MSNTKTRRQIIIVGGNPEDSSPSDSMEFYSGSLSRSGHTSSASYRVLNGDLSSSSSNTTNTITATSSSSESVQAVLANPVNGQFYVIGNPADVLGNSRSSRSLESETGSGAPRDDRRRATHNEVERRRRDMINTWIMKLGKLIPSSGGSGTEGSAPKAAQSKGGILAKACEYILELRSVNQKLLETVKQRESLSLTHESLFQENEDLKSEVTLLRHQLVSNGISPIDSSSHHDIKFTP